MAANNLKDPSKVNSAIQQMSSRMTLIAALLGGTDGMRKEGETLLPRYAAESQKNYQYRLNRSVLLNLFKKALDILVGKPFSKPVQVDDMPPALESMIEDVDRNGNHLHVFARNVFKDALAYGITHVLVEYPDLSQAPPATLADERQLNATPYFCHIPHSSMIAAYSSTVDGVERLTHVRILEESVERDGFDEVTVQRVRVLEPGTWQLWIKRNRSWVKEAEGIMTMPEIPLVTFYVEREAFMVSRPPLSDLADLNLAHWQSSSDQRNILTLTRFPLLAASGVSEEEAEKIVIGPNKLLSSTDPSGKYYYVEHAGAAISAGRQDLEDLKTEMSIMAVDMMRKSGTVTATEKAIDTSQSTSVLQDVTMRFSDFLERCFGVAAAWINLPPESYPSVTLNTDFGLGVNGQSELDNLFKLRETREISHAHFIKELKRRDLLTADFDPELDTMLLSLEDDEQLQRDLMRAELINTVQGGEPESEDETETETEA